MDSKIHLAQENMEYRAEAGFQIDALKSASDWLILKNRRFDWLRVPFSQHQFKNPSQQIQDALAKDVAVLSK